MTEEMTMVGSLVETVLSVFWTLTALFLVGWWIYTIVSDDDPRIP